VHSWRIKRKRKSTTLIASLKPGRTATLGSCRVESPSVEIFRSTPKQRRLSAEARQGKAKRGEARRGEARQGKARRGEARQDKASWSEPSRAEARRGEMKRGEARRGLGAWVSARNRVYNALARRCHVSRFFLSLSVSISLSFLSSLFVSPWPLIPFLPTPSSSPRSLAPRRPTRSFDASRHRAVRRCWLDWRENWLFKRIFPRRPHDHMSISANSILPFVCRLWPGYRYYRHLMSIINRH